MIKRRKLLCSRVACSAPCMRCRWCTDGPAELLAAAGELTILAGEALEVASGRRYRPCTHRVVAAPAPRHSVVFHLRMRRDALLDSARLRHPPHLPRLRLTAAEFVAQQTVRRPSRNQPVEACKQRPEGSASKIGDSPGAAAEGSTGQEQKPFSASQSRASRGKQSSEQAECLSGELGAQIVRQPLGESAMDAAVEPQTKGAPSSISEHG